LHQKNKRYTITIAFIFVFAYGPYKQEIKERDEIGAGEWIDESLSKKEIKSYQNSAKYTKAL